MEEPGGGRRVGSKGVDIVRYDRLFAGVVELDIDIDSCASLSGGWTDISGRVFAMIYVN